MKDEELPALFRASDRASNEAQANFLWVVKIYWATTILAAGLAAYGIKSREAAIAAAVLFLVGLCLSVLLALKQFESTWYRARAVAESVKTASWRFVTRGEPFDGPAHENVKSEFVALLRSVLREHRNLGIDLAGPLSANDQITPRMLEVRISSFEDRRLYYLTNRVEEQQSWYAKKSKYNRDRGKAWFAVLILVQSAAVVFTVLRVGYPDWSYWPTEVFVAAAAGALGWLQVKRFRELAAAYGLTAHEIGLAKAEIHEVASEVQLSEFVAQTENAFSREHTQWVARKDEA